jgi:sortase (surface protein transpeptidase)
VHAAPTPTPLPGITRLKIPAINVDAVIEYVGLTSDGAMDVPKKYEDVAWFDLGTPPGTPGNAVIAGHLDSDVAPAIFWRLGDLRPGDHIYITRADQSQLDFVVSDKQTYPWDKGPIDKIFGPASTANLNLITCGGTFDRRAKNYSNRLVVYTTLAS